MVTVAVTGAGGPAGIAVIQALSNHVVALDADSQATGFYLADAHEVIDRADQSTFASSLFRIMDKWHPDVLVSTVCEEYEKLWYAQGEIRRRECEIWLPSLPSLRNCLDKWTFANLLAEAEIPHPPTAIRADIIPGPWIIKPRKGRGSRGIRYVDDARHAFIKDTELIQTQIIGREFTADCLVGRDKILLACVPRWRIETRGGISTKGETFDLPEVTAACEDTLAAVGLSGVANVQGFVNDNGVTIIECNPRFSGGLPLTVFAGANLPDIFVRMAADPFYVPPEIKYRSGAKMSRYLTEVFDAV